MNQHKTLVLRLVAFMLAFSALKNHVSTINDLIDIVGLLIAFVILQEQVRVSRRPQPGDMTFLQAMQKVYANLTRKGTSCQ